MKRVFSGEEQTKFEQYVRHVLRKGFDMDDAISLAAQRVIKDRRCGE